MLSGGLDSTACLFKLLKDTDDDVHTFYVNLENNSHKVWCEEQAIETILPIAQRVRSFEHHTGSTFDIRGCMNKGLQPYLWMTSSALMINHIGGEKPRLCIGYTAGDSAIDALDDIRREWKILWNLLGDARRLPPLYLPLANRTKGQSMDYLRRIEHTQSCAIIKHLWTCENPERFHGPDASGYRACRRCNPCERGLEIGLVKP